MVPSEDLFSLIKSLSKSEKGHFKKYASKHVIGEQNHYIKIFDAIERQKEYDEQALKEEFKDESFLNSFAPFKVYLFNLILKSLTVYHADKSADAYLNRTLLNTEILFKKGIYKPALKHLIKAKSIAYHYEKFDTLLSLIDWEKRIILLGTFETKIIQMINKLLPERENILKLIHNIYEYESLAVRSNKLVTTSDRTRNKEDLKNIKSFLSEPLLSDERKALSDTARFFHHNVCSFLHFEAGNLNQSYKFCKKNVLLMEQHPDRIKEYPIRYLATLQNLLVFETKQNKLKEANLILNKARKAASESEGEIKNIEVKTFEWTGTSELIMLINACEFDKAQQLVPQIALKLNEFSDKIDKAYEFVFRYYISYLYFILGKFDKAKSWLDPVVNAGKSETRQDIISFSLILNLLLHFEKGNALVLEYFGKSANRYMIKKNTLNKLESLLLNFVYKKLPRLDNGSPELKKACLDLREQVNEVLKDPFEQKALSYFDINAWIESQISGKKIVDVIKPKTSN